MTTSLADSVQLLAALWTSAREVGGGEFVKRKLKLFREKELDKVNGRAAGSFRVSVLTRWLQAAPLNHSP